MLQTVFVSASSRTIFFSDAPQTKYFWMKNPPVVLESGFLDPGGANLGIQANARPKGRTIIASPGCTQNVIEIASGTAASL
ncbi:MAG: DUF192 domain-containing protein [Paracoccaceae bacterium]|nr:DUF192 domain-containing protein [Paracoccaceae bacterium]